MPCAHVTTASTGKNLTNESSRKKTKQQMKNKQLKENLLRRKFLNITDKTLYFITSGHKAC